ncbi:hypothetical protein jhhlp_006928 [Lomentospora prolificans]|uniref:SWR1-complex protein 5 n=1 Tax=Lomentospora prolificans TaxID=41688 RepID=A0A2N3N362_9PEZI|nr:hypothetical protein jhhlp_006928 [Lomentospora prolificans]
MSTERSFFSNTHQPATTQHNSTQLNITQNSFSRMATDRLADDDDNYASSEDSDFAPDEIDAADRESVDSDSDADLEKSEAPKRKRDAADAPEDVDLDNSGDETVIKKGEKRRKKKRKEKGEELDEADDDAEGGLVKTRSMRAAEKAEKKFAASSGPVTIDVDALWEQMKTGAIVGAPRVESAPKDGEAKPQENNTPDQYTGTNGDAPALTADTSLDPPDMIRIKRKYNFAGKVHTEEKLVPRDSAEAQLYLASQVDAPLPDDPSAPSKRAPRKAFRSAFEPILEPFQRRGDLALGVAARLEARDARAKKLNTVEKSRMDWAGFVDKEGIKDELELAGKSKSSYAERQDFLARSEARREEEARRARVVTRS